MVNGKPSGKITTGKSSQYVHLFSSVSETHSTLAAILFIKCIPHVQFLSGIKKG